MLALISGILGSMLNLGLAFGGSIQHAARDTRRQSGHDVERGLAALPLCGIFARRHLLPANDAKKRNCQQTCLAWNLVLLAGRRSHGVLWYGSIVLYSISTMKLGDLGTSIGWPLFLACHRDCQHRIRRINRRMGEHRKTSDPHHDCRRRLSGTGDWNSQLTPAGYRLRKAQPPASALGPSTFASLIWKRGKGAFNSLAGIHAVEVTIYVNKSVDDMLFEFSIVHWHSGLRCSGPHRVLTY